MSSLQSSHLYPEVIQVKLYQAFVFSIPILFSIILFLFFYLFYLKKRAFGISSTVPILPRTINDVSNTNVSNSDANKLCTISFDENMKTRDPMCCVCLGEFELKEQLLQVASCKHLFHIDCISHWLHNNPTCPLCRAPVVSHVNNPKSHQPAALPASQQDTIV